MPTLHVDLRYRHASGFEIDARFEAGEGVTALVGPSGSGKSTILNLIAGVLRPTDGTLRLGERQLVDIKVGIFAAPEQRRIGIVFQDDLLFPHLSVRQNLRFGMGRRHARRVDFAKVIEILEIEPYLERLPGTLSGGQQQRIAVGRALLCGPELLLLDEPLAALDDELKNRVLGYLERAFAEWRIPTLFVSHDQADVARIADRQVRIANGRIQ